MLIYPRATTHPRTHALLEDKSDCLREWLEAERNDVFHLISINLLSPSTLAGDRIASEFPAGAMLPGNLYLGMVSNPSSILLTYVLTLPDILCQDIFEP